MMQRPHTSGYTIIETVVAVAIFALMVLAIASLMTGIISAQRHERAIAEVESQGSYVLYQFAQSARNATAISFPATTSSSTNLQLISNTSSENPTYFGLAGTQFAQKRGSTATTTLTSSGVIVSSLSFQNLSAAGTKGAVRMIITLSTTNPSGRTDQAYAQTFYTTVTLR